MAATQQDMVYIKQPSPLSNNSKKMKPPQHSPPARSQFIMVAAEATTLLQAAGITVCVCVCVCV